MEDVESDEEDYSSVGQGSDVEIEDEVNYEPDIYDTRDVSDGSVTGLDGASDRATPLPSHAVYADVRERFDRECSGNGVASRPCATERRMQLPEHVVYARETDMAAGRNIPPMGRNDPTLKRRTDMQQASELPSGVSYPLQDVDPIQQQDVGMFSDMEYRYQLTKADFDVERGRPSNEDRYYDTSRGPMERGNAPYFSSQRIDSIRMSGDPLERSARRFASRYNPAGSYGARRRGHGCGDDRPRAGASCFGMLPAECGLPHDAGRNKDLLMWRGDTNRGREEPANIKGIHWGGLL